jgi:ATP-dependent DNA ligase
LADDKGNYCGCVGSGFSELDLYKIKQILDKAPRTSKLFPTEVVGEEYIPVDCGLKVQIKYYKRTEKGVLRFPVFHSVYNG